MILIVAQGMCVLATLQKNILHGRSQEISWGSNVLQHELAAAKEKRSRMNLTTGDIQVEHFRGCVSWKSLFNYYPFNYECHIPLENYLLQGSINKVPPSQQPIQVEQLDLQLISREKKSQGIICPFG